MCCPQKGFFVVADPWNKLTSICYLHQEFGICSSPLDHVIFIPLYMPGNRYRGSFTEGKTNINLAV